MDRFIVQRSTTRSTFQNYNKLCTRPLQESHRSFLNLSHPPGVFLSGVFATQERKRERERDYFYYIIVQTYDVGLHSRRRPVEFDAGRRPFASFDAPIS